MLETVKEPAEKTLEHPVETLMPSVRSIIERFIWLNSIDKDKLLTILGQEENPTIMSHLAKYFEDVTVAEQGLLAGSNFIQYGEELERIRDLLTLKLADTMVWRPEQLSLKLQGIKTRPTVRAAITDYLCFLDYDIKKHGGRNQKAEHPRSFPTGTDSRHLRLQKLLEVLQSRRTLSAAWFGSDCSFLVIGLDIHIGTD